MNTVAQRIRGRLFSRKYSLETRQRHYINLGLYEQSSLSHKELVLNQNVRKRDCCTTLFFSSLHTRSPRKYFRTQFSRTMCSEVFKQPRRTQSFILEQKPACKVTLAGRTSSSRQEIEPNCQSDRHARAIQTRSTTKRHDAAWPRRLPLAAL